MSNTPRIPQSILDQLDSEYRAFILSTDTAESPRLNELQWSPALRQMGSTADSGSRKPMDVGSKHTIQRTNYSVDITTPSGEIPFKLIAEAECVIASVDYRLAPEHPFPSGLDDLWDALVWLSKDPTKIAIAGGSAGGNLAAAVVQRASLSSPPIPLVYQALITPVIGASFSSDDRSRWTPSMIQYEHNWDPTVLEMLWFRDLYLPSVDDRYKPDASPCLQGNKLAFENMPSTWISVAELDTLRSEGEMYAEKLQAHGVPVTLTVLR
ncbi:Lipase esterase, partial [Rhizoctonia solani]